MKRISILLLILIINLLPFSSVQADVAPPNQPPGANLVPGDEGTQVRMLAENVLIDVQGNLPDRSLGHARVTANFTMLNLGSEAETMTVRFPLTFWDGSNDGWFNYPEIQDVVIKVNGQTLVTERVTTPNPLESDHPIPWAAFEVTFPPGEEIPIKVTYKATAYGEYPFSAYNYVLESGAGWKETIGSADLVVRLPYEATTQNVIFDITTGFSSTTSGATIDGREVRWHYEDLEPTQEHNLEISLVTPSAWSKVLSEQDNLVRNPQDGEAWGRLGKIYKEISNLRRWQRPDEGGKELYLLSVEAYEKALEFLPDDALWHAGFADLLWFKYYFEDYVMGSSDLTDLERAVQEIKLAYELNPDQPIIIGILDDMRYAMPEIMAKEGDSYIFLYLTATPFIPPKATNTATTSPTPVPQTPTVKPSSTVTSSLQPSATRLPTSTNTPVTQANDSGDQATNRPGLPFCGAAMLIPMSALFAWHRRRQAGYRESFISGG